jgi:hypothetical protein
VMSGPRVDDIDFEREADQWRCDLRQGPLTRSDEEDKRSRPLPRRRW